MKCETIIKKYLELDDYRSIPLPIRFHLLFCKTCRREITLLGNTFDEIRRAGPPLINKDMTARIAGVLKRNGVAYRKSVPLYNWVSGEIMIVLSIILIQFSDSMIWLKGHFGSNLELPLNIIMGSIITLYSVIFIGTHLEDFKRFVENLKKWV